MTENCKNCGVEMLEEDTHELEVLCKIAQQLERIANHLEKEPKAWYIKEEG